VSVDVDWSNSSSKYLNSTHLRHIANFNCVMIAEDAVSFLGALSNGTLAPMSQCDHCVRSPAANQRHSENSATLVFPLF
jgi:hypothetical protein